MVDYHQLGQVEDDASSENEKHENAWNPNFLQRHFSRKLMILHIIIFGIYALGAFYILSRQPWAIPVITNYPHIVGTARLLLGASS